MDQLEIIQTPRKRGRPKKNQIMEKPIKIIEKRKHNVDIKNKEIILHLPPIDKDDCGNIVPFSSQNDDSAEDNKSDVTNFQKINNCLTISDQESPLLEKDTPNFFFKNQVKEVDELLLKLKKKDKLINQLKNELDSLKKDEPYIFSREVKLIPLNITFVDNSTNQELVYEKTHIACWWDTYKFDNYPFFIPEKYYDDTFYVFGWFCSPECAAAYNENLNNYKYKECNRYSLIKKLNSCMTGHDSDISLAPPKEVLKKYGGYMTIDEYRDLAKRNKKEYRLLLPPMVNLVACIEERTRDIKGNIPEIKKIIINEKKIVPVKKKIFNDSVDNNIINTIGLTEQ